MFTTIEILKKIQYPSNRVVTFNKSTILEENTFGFKTSYSKPNHIENGADRITNKHKAKTNHCVYFSKRHENKA